MLTSLFGIYKYHTHLAAERRKNVLSQYLRYVKQPKICGILYRTHKYIKFLKNSAEDFAQNYAFWSHILAFETQRNLNNKIFRHETIVLNPKI